MNTGKITQLTSEPLPKPDWMATGSNPPIMLDEAEQKKADERLKWRFERISHLDFDTSNYLWHFKLALTLASPEDFQLLKYAAQAIADKYGL